MSYTFLLEQGEESSAECFSDIPACALSRETYTGEIFCFRDNGTESCQSFRCGMILGLLTQDRGEEEPMPYAGGSHVNDSAQQQQETIRLKTTGRKCCVLLKKQIQPSFLPKMFLEQRLKSPRKIYDLWVSLRKPLPYQRQTWVQTTLGKDIGFLATPTATANQDCPSMMKHAGCRTLVMAFGVITGEVFEWLMGWPQQWTALEPLEMDKFQQWLHLHGEYFRHEP